MARYHFNLMDGQPHQDVDGHELPTIDHAKREAVRHMGQLLITQPKQFWSGETWTLEVPCEGKGAIFEVQFCAKMIVPEEWVS